MRFLFRQLLTPEFWLLVLIGVMLFFMYEWRSRLRESVLNRAGDFMREVARNAI